MLQSETIAALQETWKDYKNVVERVLATLK